MADPFYPQRREFEQLSRDRLHAYQLQRLNALLAELVANNPFHADKLANIRLPIASLDDWKDVPFTTKQELVDAAESDRPNLTFPLAAYTRWHRTSGTRGNPLTILDTSEDWQHWIEAWQYVLDAADVTEQDRAVMAFSFGPFIGFWSAYDALVWRGVTVIPAGGMTTEARLDLIVQTRATVVCCTPTYALRMQEVAVERGRDLTRSDVKKIIVAGEPGGSHRAFRRRIEDAWDATVIDHAGATEVGPWGFADRDRTGMHVAESHFIAEFLPTDAGDCVPLPEPAVPQALPSPHASTEAASSPLPVEASPLCELVLTNLTRRGMPVIRYRTGDLVRPVHAQTTGTGAGVNHFVRLVGGVLGRVDNMVVIRGVNIYPDSIASILQSHHFVGEFRVVAFREGAMDQLRVEVEAIDAAQCQQLADELNSRIGLRIPVTNLPVGTLPRFEAKSRRFVDQRNG